MSKRPAVSIEFDGDDFTPESEEHCCDLLRRLSTTQGPPALARIRSSNGTLAIGLRNRSGQSVILYLPAGGQPHHAALPSNPEAGAAICFEADDIRYEFSRAISVTESQAIEVAVQFAVSGILSDELVWRPEGDVALT